MRVKINTDFAVLTAIVGILLGNLLIANLFAPALQRLRDILEKFASIELPHESVWPDDEKLTIEQRRRAEDAAVDEFNRLFREYEMSFNAFRKVGLVFVASIVVLACAVVWQMPLSRGMHVLAMVLSVGSIVLVGLFLQRAIAPTPSQLVSIDFLQNNFANLHLESFFDCSHLHINFGRGLGSRDPVMHFAIFQKLMFLGYRFLLAVTDQRSSRLYFASYGVLDSSADFRQYWTPEIKAFEVPLGDFSFRDALRSARSLRLHLWLFIPTPKGWLKQKADVPRFLSEEITETMGDQIGIRLCSGDCRWDWVDKCVDFNRRSLLGFSSWVISRIDASPDSAQAVLRMFKDKVEHYKHVRSQDLPSGIAVERPRSPSP